MSLTGLRKVHFTFCIVPVILTDKLHVVVKPQSMMNLSIEKICLVRGCDVSMPKKNYLSLLQLGNIDLISEQFHLHV